jgi:hypothetical protein
MIIAAGIKAWEFYAWVQTQDSLLPWNIHHSEKNEASPRFRILTVPSSS